MDIRDILLFVTVGISGVTDVRSGRVYNKVTYPAIIVGLSLNGIKGVADISSSLEGFLLAAVLMGSVALMGGIGGGDAKLLAAIGAIKGYPFILVALFYSFLVGGAMALGIAIWHGRLWVVLSRVTRSIVSTIFVRGFAQSEWKDSERYKIPFGAAICLGTLWAQLSQLLM